MQGFGPGGTLTVAQWVCEGGGGVGEVIGDLVYSSPPTKQEVGMVLS